jgi:DNA invertase Pin-like site-specific DNA recombinase
VLLLSGRPVAISSSGEVLELPFVHAGQPVVGGRWADPWIARNTGVTQGTHVRPILTHLVAYCIVHKIDRLARNRLHDAMIHYELRQAGVMLVSATETIDETPSGMLVHGIMSSIAAFYSLNLATEVTKGMVQKAAAGGTPTKAPVGAAATTTTSRAPSTAAPADQG